MNMEIRDWIFEVPFCIHLFSYNDFDRYYITALALDRKDID